MPDDLQLPEQDILLQIEDFLETYTPQVRQTALKLRQLVLKAAPGALEQVDLPARLIAYGYARTYKDTICVIMPLKAGVNLGFPRGVDLPDPHRLLAGTGKRARHVRIMEAETTDRQELLALLLAAVELTRKK
jgi:hypothetical protein